MKHILRLGLLLFGAASCVGADQQRRDTYDENYQIALRLCGNPDAAFQSGYNEGYGRRTMQNDWASMCVAEAQAPARDAYRQGFLTGAQNAPAVMVHQVQGLPRRGNAPSRDAAGAACTFDSDCGGQGWHCRNRECRGFGGIGEQCTFNDECMSNHCFGGSCRE